MLYPAELRGRMRWIIVRIGAAWKAAAALNAPSSHLELFPQLLVLGAIAAIIASAI